MTPTDKPSQGTSREALELIRDFLINEECSCARTPQHPCPRCLVTITQAREWAAQQPTASKQAVEYDHECPECHSLFRIHKRDCSRSSEQEMGGARTNLSQQDYDNLVRDAMLWRKAGLQSGDKATKKELLHILRAGIFQDVEMYQDVQKLLRKLEKEGKQ